MKILPLIVSLLFCQQMMACSCDCVNNRKNLCELLVNEELNSLVEAVYLEATDVEGTDAKFELIKNWYGTEVLDSIFYISTPTPCNTGVYAQPGDTVLFNSSLLSSDTLALWLCSAITVKKLGSNLYGPINASINPMNLSRIILSDN